MVWKREGRRKWGGNNKLNKLIYKIIFFAGIFFFIVSYMRYFFIYPDQDRLIAYCTIGLLLSGLGWVCNRLESLQKENEEQWKYTDLLENKIEQINNIKGGKKIIWG
jgi:hypothetical protein